MRITLSGPPGAGTTTVGKLVAEKLGIEFIPASRLFREMAEEKGMSLEDFNKLCELDEKFDKQMDEKQKEYMNLDNFVIDSRLSPYFIENADFRVYLHASLDERARRVSQRDNITEEEAIKRINEREESERKRYAKYYGIDLTDLSLYDIMLNSSKWSAEKIADIIVNAIRQAEVSQ